MIALAFLNYALMKTINLVARCNYRIKCCRKVGMMVDHQIILRYPIMKMFVESFIEIVFSSYINTNCILRTYDLFGLDHLFANPTDGLNTVCLAIGVSSVLILPFYYSWQMSRNFDRLGDDDII